MSKNYLVAPSKLSGEITLPPSKSQTLRALLLASFAEGESCISNVLESPDTSYLIEILRKAGAEIEKKEDTYFVEGLGSQFKGFSQEMHVGNSGILLRFLTAIAAFYPSKVVITGDASTCQRPMEDLTSALRELGAKVTHLEKEGKAPLEVFGSVTTDKAHLKGEDSQPVSALLFASAVSQKAVSLEVSNPGEIPWVKLTLSWLRRLNIPYKASEDLKSLQVMPKGIWKGFSYKVPGDASTLAFPVLASLVTKSPLTIRGVDRDPSQGDYIIFDAWEKMGARLIWDKDTLRVDSSTLKASSIDIAPCIDALPACAALACFAEGTTELYNAKMARSKECDRLKVMEQELSKMGAKLSSEKDKLFITGKSLQGAHLNSHGDHRIAMALTCIALAAKDESQIEDVSWIQKTFPHFTKAFNHLGAKITECA